MNGVSVLRHLFEVYALCLALSVISPQAGLAATLNVNPGSSVQSAIVAANHGDVIVLARGTYLEQIDFLGKAITVRSTDPANPAVVASTIIDGGAGNDTKAVVTFKNVEKTNSVLLGLTISGGRNESRAGGIDIIGASPTIAGNIIRDNRGYSGGGIHVSATTSGSPEPWITNNKIIYNQAFSGAGIYGLGSVNLHLSNNLIAYNKAVSHGGLPAGHGGLSLAGAAAGAEILSCTIVYNTGGPDQAGGAFITANSSGSLMNCLIAYNTGYGLARYGNSDWYPSYCDVFNNSGGDYHDYAGGLWNMTGLSGNVSVSPRFAGPKDFHLLSVAGRWEPTAKTWVYDQVTSACIHKGNGREMGVYGGTTEASKPDVPVIANCDPAKNATDAPRHPQIAIEFNMPVDHASTKAHFSLKTGSGTPVAGKFTWPVKNRKLVFTPNKPLASNALHTVRLAAGIQRTDGPVTQKAASFSFTTGNRPVVVSALPTGAIVPVNTSLVIKFDRPMDTAISSTYLKTMPAIATSSTWSSDGKTRTSKLLQPLQPDTDYEIQVWKASSATGVDMKYAYVWRFHTAPAPEGLNLTAVAAAAAGRTAVLTICLSSAATVQVNVLNLAGREVAALPEQVLEAGVSTLWWQGQTKTGTQAPAGQYLLRVIARSESGPQAQALTGLRLP